MPIYEYRCQDCAYTFEKKQSMKDEPVAVCERCGKNVRRIISPPAIMFKGSGWYVTDYSDKLKPPATESSGTASPAKDNGQAATPSSTPAPAASSAPAPAASNSSSTSGGSSSSGASDGS